MYILYCTACMICHIDNLHGHNNSIKVFVGSQLTVTVAAITDRRVTTDIDTPSILQSFMKLLC